MDENIITVRGNDKKDRRGCSSVCGTEWGGGSCLPTQAALQVSQGQRLLVWQQLGHDLCVAPHDWTGSAVETRKKLKFETSYHLKEGTRDTRGSSSSRVRQYFHNILASFKLVYQKGTRGRELHDYLKNILVSLFLQPERVEMTPLSLTIYISDNKHAALHVSNKARWMQ